MLRCTACRVELAPFAMAQPEVEQRCHRCGAELTFRKRSQTEIQVDGPALPPVPAGLSVASSDGAESYRERAGGTLVIRWRVPFDSAWKAVLGLLVGLTVVAWIAAVFLGPPLWLVAITCLAMTLLLGLVASFTKGEVQVGSGLVHARRGAGRRVRTAQTSTVTELWIVDVGQERSFDGSAEIWMRSPDGTAAPLVSGLPSGRIPHYVAARLRQELGLD